MNAKLIAYSFLFLILLIGVYAAESSLQASVQVLGLQEDFVTINSPQSGWLSSTKPYVNASFKEKVKYAYYKINNGKETSFCSACSSYKKSISLPQGLVNLTIRAVNYSNINYSNSVILQVDSVAPKISSYSPSSGKYANGDFGVYYTELNLKEIVLRYGTNSSNLDRRSIFVDCLSGVNKWCYNHIDLTEFNGKTLYYNFILRDNFFQISSSRLYAKVDTTFPSLNINSPQNQSYNTSKTPGYSYFNLTTSELVTLQYSDNNKAYVALSTGRNYYYGSKYLGLGQHNVTFKAYDPAGNTVLERRSFILTR